MDDIKDILIIGGGINGVGIARDAAGRGLSVFLCEQDDLAAHTSSASTKLIHGGLRYLEHFEFRLVSESLKEREVLLGLAPHIIWPLRFILPYEKSSRPAWLLRLGLFIYDHLGGRKILPPTRRADLKSGLLQGILKEQFTFGFEYSDCWVNDARLVVLNAVDAAKRGAKVRTQTKCVGLVRKGDHWKAVLETSDGHTENVFARAVINAAGPWVDDIAEISQTTSANASARLVKGSHIVVRKLYEGEHCYIFQNADNRIIFAIPYEEEFTLLGTTDLNFQGDKTHVEISSDEIDYICTAASEYFNQPVRKENIVWSYAGIRPLYEDQSNNNSVVTRDYVFRLDDDEQDAPFLSIYGGKITTYRKLAEHALERLMPFFKHAGPAWTAHTPLPGGEIEGADFEHFFKTVQKKYAFVPEKHLYELCRRHGARVQAVLENSGALGDLGIHFGSGLYEKEIIYLLSTEFCTHLDDILWRRTKFGLHLNETEKRKLADWFDTHGAA